MKIKPMMSSGVPILSNDGDNVQMMPLQVFQTGNFNVIRLGRNIIVFDKDGNYDGLEAKVLGSSTAEDYKAALFEAIENIGEPPDEAYYQPGSNGWQAETASWPKKRRKRKR